VAIADETDGVIAARMTGAGFGGCTVNLVRAASAAEAASGIVERYQAAMGLEARSWISRPAEGAGPVELRIGEAGNGRSAR
jgi:galactokinase